MVCPRCASMYVKKDGVKRKKKGFTQQYRCNSCARYFSVPIETEIKEYKEVKPGEVFRYESDKVIRVHGLTDIHVGANEFDLEKFRKLLKLYMKMTMLSGLGMGI